MLRRHFLSQSLAAPAVLAAPPKRPNVLLILTDDQGYGDLSLHGNPHLKTPHMDSIARQGVQFTQFHVSPVCSPTRSSLMTGRYNYRTRVVDTYIGRSMMDPQEVTLAQMLGAAGYRTGIFGKWHLGDNYPLRAIDHGFQEALVLRGGGLAQPADAPGSTGYFNPILRRLYCDQFNAIWRDVDCLFTPCTPTPAPKLGQYTMELHGKTEDVRLATTQLLRGINVLGLPALAMPMGLSKSGLPMSLQIVGPAFSEARLLQVGAALEDERGPLPAPPPR